MKPTLLFATALLSAGAACAADLPATNRPIETAAIEDTARAAALRAWKISLAPLVASQALDACSSYGMRELNPLLASDNGGFGMKGVAIKLAVTSAVVGVEYLVIRKYPRSTRVISKLNWTTGIVTTGFALHNYAIK
jgi:hypothetical protein